MAYQEILYEKDDKGLALITLNRPESLNAFKPLLWSQPLQKVETERSVVEISGEVQEIGLYPWGLTPKSGTDSDVGDPVCPLPFPLHLNEIDAPS